MIDEMKQTKMKECTLPAVVQSDFTTEGLEPQQERRE